MQWTVGTSGGIGHRVAEAYRAETELVSENEPQGSVTCENRGGDSAPASYCLQLRFCDS